MLAASYRLRNALMSRTDILKKDGRTLQAVDPRLTVFITDPPS